MPVDEMIAELQALGYHVVMPRDDKDTQLRRLWDSALKDLRMAQDIARDGAKLTVRHPAWLGQNADAARLLRDSAVSIIDTIFENAVVEREARDAA